MDNEKNTELYSNQLPKLDLGQGDYGNVKNILCKNIQHDLGRCCSKECFNDENTVVVKINRERCTIDNVDRFKNYISTNYISAYPEIILDLSLVEFIDSTFLGSIILLFKNVKAKKHSIKLVVDLDKIKIMTPFKQLKSLIDTYSSVEQALDT